MEQRRSEALAPSAFGAGRILAWAVRPGECEIKAISAEGAADIVACIPTGVKALRNPGYRI
jgi:hypothetical protein